MSVQQGTTTVTIFFVLFASTLWVALIVNAQQDIVEMAVHVQVGIRGGSLSLSWYVMFHAVFFYLLYSMKILTHELIS